MTQAYQRLMTFINRNLPDKFHIEGIQRIDIRDKIFREMAANMLIHREYSNSFPAKFLIFSDKVITENWTKPSGQSPVTLETLETHPKNPMIARVFKELGWVEELGSGRKNIMKYAPHYYQEYCIEIVNEEKFFFSLTYRGDDENENEKINDENENVNDENENVNENERPLNENGDNLKISEYQSKMIYALISENVNDKKRPLNNEERPLNDEERPLNDKIKNYLRDIVLLLLKREGMNRNDFIKKLGIGRTSIFQCLQILREANIVEYFGSKKTGGYYLTQKAKDRLQNDNPFINSK